MVVELFVMNFQIRHRAARLHLQTSRRKIRGRSLSYDRGSQSHSFGVIH